MVVSGCCSRCWAACRITNVNVIVSIRSVLAYATYTEILLVLWCFSSQQSVSMVSYIGVENERDKTFVNSVSSFPSFSTVFWPFLWILLTDPTLKGWSKPTTKLSPSPWLYSLYLHVFLLSRPATLEAIACKKIKWSDHFKFPLQFGDNLLLYTKPIFKASCPPFFSLWAFEEKVHFLSTKYIFWHFPAAALRGPLSF